MHDFARLTGGTLLLELLTNERPELLTFLLTPGCAQALTSDQAFLAWAQEQLRDDPELLSRIRGALDATRTVLLAAARTGPRQKGAA